MNSTQNPQISIDQAIQNTRKDILEKQADSNVSTMIGFDGMVQQFRALAKQFQTQNVELGRLQELCKKNNINTKTIPPSLPVKELPKNEAVTPPIETPSKA